MATEKLTAVFELKDKLSNKLNKIYTGFSKVKQEATKTGTQGSAAMQKLTRTSKTAESGFSRFGRTVKSSMSGALTSIKKFGTSGVASLNKVGNKLKGMFTGMGAKMFGGLALGASVYKGAQFVGSSFQKAIDFEAQMLSIQALTNITGDELAKMQALALKMGADTVFDAMESGKAIEALLKAGVSVQQVHGGALEAALNTAVAGDIGIEEAAEVMATALNAFSKDAISAAKASDILAGTANASATDIHELSYGLKMVSAVAAGMGLSLEDTSVALGVFANKGMDGSDAGTSLKTMLLNLVPITDKAYNNFQRLGLLVPDVNKSMEFLSSKGIKPATKDFDGISNAVERHLVSTTKLKAGTVKAAKATREYMMLNGLMHSAFYDNNGDIKGMEDMANIMQTAFKDMTAEQRQTTFKETFGTDAIRAANILYEEGAAGIQKFRAEMANVTALDVAKKKMEGSAGAVEQLSGAIETLQISALLPTMPLIRDFANGMADSIESITPEFTEFTERMTKKLQDHIAKKYTNNSEFQSLTTFEAKVKYVFDDFQDSISSWMDNGGRDSINKGVQSAMGYIGTMLANTAPQIANVALQIGSSIGMGLINGLIQGVTTGRQFTESELFKQMDVKIQGIAAGKMDEWNASLYKDTSNLNVRDKVTADANKRDTLYKIQQNTKSDPYRNIPRNHNGLTRVPRDNYATVLHKNERVLTEQENADYSGNIMGNSTPQTSSGGAVSGSFGGVVVQIAKLADSMVVREDVDIDKISDAVARKIVAELIAVGGNR